MHQLVDEGVIDDHDESPTGCQDTSQFGERCLPVLQVVKDQARSDVVERAVGEA
jgi:hypothetical protein